MPMANPPHPGRMVLRDCVESLGLTVPQAAEHLQMPVSDLESICNQESPITADVALRLEQAFGSTADAWLRMQNSHDLAKGRETAPQIEPLHRRRVVPAQVEEESLRALLERLAKSTRQPSPLEMILEDASPDWSAAIEWVSESLSAPSTDSLSLSAAA